MTTTRQRTPMKKLGALVPIVLVLIVPAAIWGSYAMAADAQQMQQAYESLR